MELKEHQESLLRLVLNETAARPTFDWMSGSMWAIFDQHLESIRHEITRVYPVIQKTLGAQEFEKLLLKFSATYRPLSADTREIAEEFFKFFSKHKIVSEIPVYGGLAKIELHREQARLAPLAKPMGFGLLIQKLADPESSTLSPQPHVRVTSFNYPAYTLWRWSKSCCESNAEEECARLPIREYEESTLTFRSGDNVVTRKISFLEAKFIRELFAGKTIGQIESSIGKVQQEFVEYLISHSLLQMDS